MIIVAGHLVVAPEDRAAYLDGCAEVVNLARAASGCHDFSVSPDLVDPGRINVFESWATREQLEKFRGGGPSDELQSAIISAFVEEFDV